MNPTKKHTTYITLPVLTAAVLLLLCFFSNMVVIDDAFISYRYLDNLLAGHGLVFNPGDRVEGYTNFLWILCLIPLRMIGVEPEIASWILSSLALAGVFTCVFFITLRATENKLISWGATITLTACSLALGFWTFSGMETIFFTLLVCLGTLDLARKGFFSVSGSLFFALATLTRPDGILFYSSYLISCVKLNNFQIRTIKNTAIPLSVFFIPVIGHLLFRYLYYGDILPNTFYVKLTGFQTNILGLGFGYLKDFIWTGGILLITFSFAVILDRRFWSRLTLFLVLGILFQTFYTIRIGGDIFPYHRFLVPALPALAILATFGAIAALGKFKLDMDRLLPALVLAIAVTAQYLSIQSPSDLNAKILGKRHVERERIAGWLNSQFPDEAVLAVNAAGLIPYRTGFYTIDMLGLNDRHIARAKTEPHKDGIQYTGHYKHDAQYVLDKRPDILITAGANLLEGRNAREAILNSAAGTFTGDRDFLRLPQTAKLYEPKAVELMKGKYLVAYLKNENQAGIPDTTGGKESNTSWFDRGVAYLTYSQFHEAIEAFQKEVEINPENSAAWTNMGYSYFDLGQYEQAIAIFQRVLKEKKETYEALYGLAQSYQYSGRPELSIRHWKRYIDEAPDSPWKTKATEYMNKAKATQ